jgi:hypothetical protein
MEPVAGFSEADCAQSEAVRVSPMSKPRKTMPRGRKRRTRESGHANKAPLSWEQNLNRNGKAILRLKVSISTEYGIGQFTRCSEFDGTMYGKFGGELEVGL